MDADPTRVSIGSSEVSSTAFVLKNNSEHSLSVPSYRLNSIDTRGSLSSAVDVNMLSPSPHAVPGEVSPTKLQQAVKRVLAQNHAAANTMKTYSSLTEDNRDDIKSNEPPPLPPMVSPPLLYPRHQNPVPKRPIHSTIYVGILGNFFMSTEHSLLFKASLTFIPFFVAVVFLMILLIVEGVDVTELLIFTSAFVLCVMSSSLLVIYFVRATESQHVEMMGECMVPCVQIETVIARFVPTEFLALLGKESITDIYHGDRVLTSTAVLFTGIRGFHHFTSKMTASAAFKWLAQFTDRMTPVIRKNKGFVDKYLGDGIMALNRDPTRALLTALQMQLELTKINDEAEELVILASQRPHDEDHQYLYVAECVGVVSPGPIVMGVAIHAGVVCVGTVGDTGRLDTTIISNVVNLAARFERLTKHYGVSILISEVTCRSIDMSKIIHRSLGKVRVKGSRESYELIDVYHTDTPSDRRFKTETMQKFCTALEYYRARNFDAASRLFKYRLPPGDHHDACYKAALTKAHYCEKYKNVIPFPAWDGEDVWELK